MLTWKQKLLYVAQNPPAFFWWLRERIAPRLPLPSFPKFGGFWFAYNDFLGSHVFLGTYFENNSQQFLLNYLKPGMTVIDIGAHHGFYSLLASRKVGPTGEVISFEPSPRELQKLKLHIGVNRCQNVHIEEVALGSQAGKTEMFVCIDHSGLNSLRQPGDESTTKVEITIVKLDDVISRLGISKVDLIKMDVEGGELEVVKGAVELLDHLRPVILYEIQDIRTTPWGYEAKELFQFLNQHGYKSFYVQEDGRLKPCPDKEKFDDNLVAVPEEKLSDPHLLTMLSNNLT